MFCIHQHFQFFLYTFARKLCITKVIIFFIISPIENVFFHTIIQVVLQLVQVASPESVKSCPECFLLAIQFWLPLLVLSSLFLMAKRNPFIKPCMYLLKRSLTPFFVSFFLVSLHCSPLQLPFILNVVKYLPGFFSLLFQFQYLLCHLHSFCINFILKLKFSPCLLLTKT